MTRSTAARRALVTGATGFIGSHLAQGLLESGWQVDAIVRPSSKIGLLGGVEKRITLHTHDGTIEGMVGILRRSQPDVVFHLASLFLGSHRPEEVTPLIQSNVLFGTQLVEAMQAVGCRTLLNTGTSWQHFENGERNPVNLYAATKQAFETILAYYVNACGFKVITLKLFDTYGPGDPRPKLFAALQKAAEAAEPIAMSPGEQRLDLVHVDDVVRAYVVAAERLLSGAACGHETYAVSSEHPMRLRDIAAVFEETTGARLDLAWGGRPYRQREVMVPWNTGVALPGWKPLISLPEGLGRLGVVPAETTSPRGDLP